jgi:hypothetical protein
MDLAFFKHYKLCSLTDNHPSENDEMMAIIQTKSGRFSQISEMKYKTLTT